jgi:hypothetical protein
MMREPCARGSGRETARPESRLQYPARSQPAEQTQSDAAEHQGAWGRGGGDGCNHKVVPEQTIGVLPGGCEQRAAERQTRTDGETAATGESGVRVPVGGIGADDRACSARAAVGGERDRALRRAKSNPRKRLAGAGCGTPRRGILRLGFMACSCTHRLQGVRARRRDARHGGRQLGVRARRTPEPLQPARSDKAIMGFSSDLLCLSLAVRMGIMGI